MVRHSIDNLEVQEIEGERQYRATAGWTAAWYAIPCALYLAWLFLIEGNPGVTCGPAGINGCQSDVPHALLHGLSRIGAALATSVLVALLLRRGSAAWHPITSAFAAAVIGAGAATIGLSMI